MPKSKRVLNAFTCAEVVAITGLSSPMVDYLSRSDFLHAAYAEPEPGQARVRPGKRGKVRYYSYRDLVVARVVQRLREHGVELSRLKDAIQRLATDDTMLGTDRTGRLGWLLTDGRSVYLKADDGFLDEFGPRGQRAFAFVVDVGKIGDEVKAGLSLEKAKRFTMRKEPIEYEVLAEAVSRRRRG